MSATKVPQELVSGTYPAGPFSVADASTITIDPSQGNVCNITPSLGGNRTLSISAGASDGQKLLIRVPQDATGSRTLTPDSTIRVGTSPVAWTLTTTASKMDRLGFEWIASAGKWDFIAVAQGF